MAEYITKIRTEKGDKQIDYQALANLPQADSTLSKSGQFADAKAVGDKIQNINEKIQGAQGEITGHSHNVATTTSNGFMSSDDKKTLNDLKTFVGNTPVSEQIDAVSQDIQAVQGVANNATSLANAAQSAADNAQQSATNAQNAANAAQTTANSAQTVANAAQVKHITRTATLSSGSWSSKKQTVSVSGVTASNTVIVTHAPASYANYVNCHVRCTAQAADSLTFTCDTVPSANITVNVLILN